MTISTSWDPDTNLNSKQQDELLAVCPVDPTVFC